jgi:hypothetical protein
MNGARSIWHHWLAECEMDRSVLRVTGSLQGGYCFSTKRNAVDSGAAPFSIWQANGQEGRSYELLEFLQCGSVRKDRMEMHFHQAIRRPAGPAPVIDICFGWNL